VSRRLERRLSILQASRKQAATTMQSAHHGAERDTEAASGILVCELVHVDENENFSEALR
jgi:hypothetical protein